MKLRLFLCIILCNAALQKTHHIIKPRPRRLVIVPYIDTLILNEYERMMFMNRAMDLNQLLLDRIDGIKPPVYIRRVGSWPLVQLKSIKEKE
jgi:hypothetical protein